jgi:hypothetical protein
MVWVLTFGMMDASTMVNGKITIWKVSVYTSGLMVEDTKDSTIMIRKVAMVFIVGQMVANMKVGGIKVNNMALELT